MKSPNFQIKLASQNWSNGNNGSVRMARKDPVGISGRFPARHGTHISLSAAVRQYVVAIWAAGCKGDGMAIEKLQ